jgi:hypothetical protein
MFAKAKLVALTAVALAIAGDAQAGEFHVGNAMFDAILNNALAARRSYYGVGDSRCPLVATYGRYGNRTGQVHTCELPPRISNGVIEMHSRRLIVGDEDKR